MTSAPGTGGESGMQWALRFFGLRRRGPRNAPTRATFWLLECAAVLGVAVALLTHGWPVVVGRYLGVACAVLGVQVWLHQRRAR